MRRGKGGCLEVRVGQAGGGEWGLEGGVDVGGSRARREGLFGKAVGIGLEWRLEGFGRWQREIGRYGEGGRIEGA